MPTYTIQMDAPWESESRPPSAVSASVYSDNAGDSSPRSIKPPPPYALHETQIPDHGPQTTRPARLPIFTQVKTMLTKSTVTSSRDDMPADPTDAAKPAHVKPSVFDARRYSPSLKSLKTKKNRSNVSILRESESSSVTSGQSSPSTGSPVRNPAPSQISVNAVSQLPRGVTATNQVKRKPVMSLSSPMSENVPPRQDLLAVPNTNLASRFSWSTAAPSEAPKRQSTDTMATGGRPQLVSHFSWTTIATSAAPTPNEEVDDPTALPPMPSPHQEREEPRYEPESILSRKRPIQRLDKDDWVPSTPRQRAATGTSDDSTPRATPASTPRARNVSLNDETPRKADSTSRTATPTATIAGKKALPSIPFMTEKQATHLEQLITTEKNLVMQRQNIERAITDLEKVERASPLDVPFAAVRDAKRKLDERRETLREVKMEEMDIGIRIARARRREDFGEGEGSLWVRRVTG